MRLALGVLGRMWLWFVAGALLITFVPMLFGWRPYIVEGDSMRPRIAIGDVVLAAPTDVTTDIVGRVITFDDPAKPDRIVSHRAIAINPDGSVQTRGDANANPDSTPVPSGSVHGIGRLLVRFVGLPLIWAQTGQLWWLGLFLLSLLAGVWVVSRDREDDPPPDSLGDDQSARQLPPQLDPMLKRVSAAPVTIRRRWARRTGLAGICSLLIAIPTTAAAFADISRNTTNNWNVPNLSYTTETLALGPYLYWKLDDASTTAVDASGNGHPGTYNGTIAQGVVGGLVTDTPNLAVTASGTGTCINSSAAVASITAPAVATFIGWFKTNTTNGGKIVGFEKPQSGVAVPSTGTYDRMLYLDGAGRVWFGVYNGGYFTLSSTSAGQNDNTWHMAVGVLAPTGMRLYLDGVLQASNANGAGEPSTGWFRAGCGNLGGWGGSWGGANNPTTATNPTQNRPLAGSLDEITVFTTALTAAQIRVLYFAR